LRSTRHGGIAVFTDAHQDGYRAVSPLPCCAGVAMRGIKTVSAINPSTTNSMVPRWHTGRCGNRLGD